MLISKFDLYKSEWLELVFDDRNKAYGAYELRQHYPRTLLMAMGIAFLSITALVFGVGILIKPIAIPVEHLKFTEVPLIHYVQPQHPKPPSPAHPHVNTPPVAPASPAAMHQSPSLVVAPDPLAVEPPKITDMKGDLGPVDIKGPTGPVNIDAGPGGGTAAAPGNGNTPVSVVGLERMPEPYGGAGAWSKFLQKYLKYPDMAADSHIQGRVWISFIVEKDGHLSNFIVDRGMGYGLDEEALRVLKLAPAWKPGIQNGQPVRVKYNIPINFQLNDD